MRYMLHAEHVYKTGEVLPPGTIVGDGTNWPWPDPPSTQMEGLDPEAKKATDEVWQRLYGTDAQFAPATTDMRPDEGKIKAELASKPVSDQQARERGVALPSDALKPIQALPRSPGAMPAPGLATPKVDSDDARPTKPNEEQSPKG